MLCGEEMQVYSKRELKERMRRFMADADRGISLLMFAEFAGVSVTTLQNYFVTEAREIDPTLQIRISRALQSWENGEVAVMIGPRGSRYLAHRKVPKPKLVRHFGLKATPEGFRLDMRVRNKADYSEPTLIEQMEGKNGY